MRAVVYEEYGPAEVLKQAHIARPVPKDNEVLVEVYASSVNPVDWKIRNGDFKVISGFRPPHFTGGDLAGKVVEVGSLVKRFMVGDEVYGLVSALQGGACAEFVAIDEKELCLKPANLTFIEAASMPLAAQTALQALRDKGKIKKGQKVLINGCSGGVGVFAVQLAKDFETEVTGVCSASNHGLAKKLGCDYVVDYKQVDITESGQSFDLIFDAVGKMGFNKAKNILKNTGIYVSTLPTMESIVSSGLSKLWGSKKAEVIMLKSNKKDLNTLKNLCENGKFNTVIDKVYSMDEIVNAHRYSETEHASGKIAIKIR